MSGMTIRRYVPADCEQIAALFYQTVHTVNARDYTPEQLDVWATGQVELEEWNRSFLEHICLVAVEEEEILGFGDITGEGYLDRLYVHRNHQGEGIATALCDRLERQASGRTLVVHASITARPFFEKRGYQVVKRQQVCRQGIWLTNFVMEKSQTPR